MIGDPEQGGASWVFNQKSTNLGPMDTTNVAHVQPREGGVVRNGPNNWGSGLSLSGGRGLAMVVGGGGGVR